MCVHVCETWEQELPAPLDAAGHGGNRAGIDRGDGVPSDEDGSGAADRGGLHGEPPHVDEHP